MEKLIKKTNRREYNTPNLVLIKLDNEISLILESEPPTGPNESINNITSDYFKNDPFKNNLG